MREQLVGILAATDNGCLVLLARHFQPAATEIEIIDGTVVVARLVDVGMKRVDHKAAVLDVLDKTGVAEDAEMMGNVDDEGVQQFGQFADVMRTTTQDADDA